MDSSAPSRAEYVEAHRPRLIGLAYRMLGSVTEAQDLVQDVAVRFLATDPAGISKPEQYLTSMTARACIDYLRSATRRREVYVGPWLPEPVRTEGEDVSDPAAGLESAESVSMAFLVLMQKLTPLERAAFLLHVVFDYEHAEVGRILGRTEAACRQLVSRARAHLRGGRPRFDVSSIANRSLTERFLNAARNGDIAGLVTLLTQDVTLWADGGGKVAAAIKPVRGPDKVARYLAGVFKKAPGLEATIEEVNGEPTVVLCYRGRPDTSFSLAVREDRIAAVFSQRNPDKLTRLSPVSG